MFCYQLGAKTGGPVLRTHLQMLDWLRELGFQVNPLIAPHDDLASVFAFCGSMEAMAVVTSYMAGKNTARGCRAQVYFPPWRRNCSHSWPARSC